MSQPKDKDWLNGYKNKPLYMLSPRDPPQTKGHIQTESEGLEKVFHANGDQKKAEVGILISDKIDFKTKTVKRDKDGHYIMIKGSIQEEYITIINIYAPNIKVKVKSLSRVRLFATPWTVAYQAPLSMGFSRQGYWSGLPFPSPGIFPTQGSNSGVLHCRQTLYRLSHILLMHPTWEHLNT